MDFNDECKCGHTRGEHYNYLGNPERRCGECDCPYFTPVGDRYVYDYD